MKGDSRVVFFVRCEMFLLVEGRSVLGAVVEISSIGRGV